MLSNLIVSITNLKNKEEFVTRVLEAGCNLSGEVQFQVESLRVPETE